MSTNKFTIGTIPIFDRLSDKDVKRIAKVGTEVNVPANWSLMSEKTPADKAYIVLEGELSVRKGKEEIATLGPGDVVGETAIVSHRLRNASVVTTTEACVLHFTREAVEQLRDEIPTFAEALELAAGRRSGDSSDG